jgi:hypothetical protein
MMFVTSDEQLREKRRDLREICTEKFYDGNFMAAGRSYSKRLRNIYYTLSPTALILSLNRRPSNIDHPRGQVFVRETRVNHGRCTRRQNGFSR